MNAMLDRFIEYIVVQRRYSPLTAQAYRADVGGFMAYMEVAPEDFDPARHLTADAVRGWILALAESRRNGPSTINRKVSSLRSFHKWLRRTGAAGGDPFVGVAQLKTPTRLPAFVPEADMRKVLAADAGRDEISFVGRRNNLIVLLFYSTGIRLAELLGIRMGDFSADMSRLRVRGKGGKERIVPVVKSVRGEIKGLVAAMKDENICNCDEELLFLTDKGAPLSRTEVYRAVRGSLAAAGVQGKASPHVLRHTFATHILNDGADMRQIQELLGHGSLGATQVYTHNDIARLKEVYAAAHPRAGKNKKEGLL